MGNSFFIKDEDPDRVGHLYIIISSPDKDHQRVAYAPMSTLDEWKVEHDCRINKGEHPRAHHDSVIEFRHSFVESEQWLHEKVKAYEARQREDFGQDLLDRIHEKAEDSDYIPQECYDVLYEQNLLPSTRP